MPPADVAEIARIIAAASRTDMVVAVEPRRRIDLSRTFIRGTDFSGANPVGANLSFADCREVLFRDVDFRDANLEGTNLVGADLSESKNLTADQIGRAITDTTTRLPPYLR